MSSAAPSASEFVRVSRDQWRLADSVSDARLNRLLDGPTYEEIVTSMVSGSTLVAYRREREKASEDPRFFRVVVTLNVGATIIDLFHNSACGYRAQYYHDKQKGIQANSFALSVLASHVVTLLGRFKRTCPPWWVEKSLLDPNAKAWIHQGQWLRRAKRSDRQLLVARWSKQQECQDAKRRKKAVWASLAPAEEAHLELKGGFLTAEGTPLGSLKPARTRDLYELGFT